MFRVLNICYVHNPDKEEPCVTFENLNPSQQAVMISLLDNLYQNISKYFSVKPSVKRCIMCPNLNLSLS